LSGPADLAASIPHLLGFHPTDSFVLVWLSEDRIVLTQRIDDAALDDLLMNSMLLVQPARHVGGETVFVTHFPTDPDTSPRGLLDLAAALEHAGVTVLDALSIGRDWWRSATCAEDCCTQGPRALDAEVLNRVAADFVLDGVNVLADRSDLLAEVAPDVPRVSEVSKCWTANPDLPALVTTCVTLWRRTGPRGGIDVQVTVAHLVALDNVRARDALIWHLARLDSVRSRCVAELLRAVLRAAPAGHVAPIATLAAIAAWLSGDGARALVALERGLSEEPNYRLALMVHAAVCAGLPPAKWRQMVLQTPCAEIGMGASQVNPV
jgi:hypothetical protein